MTYSRRYTFALYPLPQQAEALHRQRRMIGELWNALLQRHEDIRRRTVQRQIWFDASGKRHVGETVHNPRWVTERYKHGERHVFEPDETGKPKRFTAYDMQNEITWLANSLPEWRELSIWSAHRTAQLLDRAFKAFFSRAKNGGGAASGYPRFKRAADHDGIPHRFASGCKVIKDTRHERSWQVALKGVPGEMHARGIFPAEVKKWTDANVLWRDGSWWLSVAVKMAPRRTPGRGTLTVRLDLIDEFATVNGLPETPPGLAQAMLLDERADEMLQEHDLRWPRGRRFRDDEDRRECRSSRRDIARIAGKAARVRRHALHTWTARIIGRASDLTIVAPPVRENTRTPRGDERQWGANVAVVSGLNRNTLQQAPAMAVAMLRYKAEEAGIRCDVVTDATPDIAVGRELVAAGKQLRRARRELKEMAA